MEIEWVPLELNGIEYNRRDDESLLMLDACVALHFSEIEIEWLPLELNGIEYNRRDDESLLMFTWWYKCLM